MPHSTQSIKPQRTASSSLFAFNARIIRTGDSWQLQWVTHFPHPMQGLSSSRLTSSLVKKRTPDVFFCTGKSALFIAKPIIGPPEMILVMPGFKRMTSGMRSPIQVPIGASTFTGFSQAPPESVSGRSIRGMPLRNASEIAFIVPTF